MQHEKCATVAVGSGSRVPCPDYPAMPPGRAMQPAHVALGAPSPPPLLYSCQDTVDPFGEFTSTFRRQKVGAAAAAKFIRLKFARNYLSK